MLRQFYKTGLAVLLLCCSGVTCDLSEENAIPNEFIKLIGDDPLEHYLQPNDVINGAYDDIFLEDKNNENNELLSQKIDLSGTNCIRQCDGIPRTCYYKFRIEHWFTMGYACGNCTCNNFNGCTNLGQCNNTYCITADTIPRNIITVNKRYPGPPIYVCKGDRVVVDVTNALQGKAASLHWHGIFQKGTPWMDGVSMLSQCPILPGTTYRYNFIAAEPGTHFWHDHTGLIKQDGVQGPLIVRQPRFEVPNSAFYDYDLPSHVMFLNDWKHFISDDEFPIMKTFARGRRIEALLINGKGLPFTNPNTTSYREYANTPLATFKVQRGNSYRFRVIGAFCMMCAMELIIQNHDITVIAVDGNPVLPTTLNSLVITSGERFDIVVNALQNVGTYWIHLRGIWPCHQTMQVAVLRYDNGPPVPRSYYLPPSQILRTVNHPNFSLRRPANYLMSELSSSLPTPTEISNPTSTAKFTFVVSRYDYNDEQFEQGQAPLFFKPFAAEPPFRSTINGISSTAPSYPLYSQFKDVNRDQLCSEECVNGTSATPCQPCVHLVKIPLNRTVDFIITDPSAYTGIVHPFHLHGHKFYVLEQGELTETVTTSSLLQRLEAGDVRSLRPPIKDTIIVPLGTYAIIRFFTDNPGVWVFHCHYIYHNAAGMHVFLQVGEYSDFPRPPINWPTCGNYVPPI